MMYTESGILTQSILTVVCHHLNYLYNKDPACIRNLFNYKAYTSNSALVNETSVIVGSDEDGRDYLRVIGLLNGLFGTQQYRLAVKEDDHHGGIIGFKVVNFNEPS